MEYEFYFDNGKLGNRIIFETTDLNEVTNLLNKIKIRSKPTRRPLFLRCWDVGTKTPMIKEDTVISYTTH